MNDERIDEADENEEWPREREDFYHRDWEDAALFDLGASDLPGMWEAADLLGGACG